MKGSQTISAIIIGFCLSATAALLIGCDRKANAVMTEIEAVLDNALDSAEIIPAIRSLDSIPVDDLGDRSRALHALLTVHSRHKQHLPLSSDSLIFKEAAYFNGSSDTYHQMKWHFYRGATRLELQDYRGAILDALHAARLSKQLPDTLFMAKSEELLGDIYHCTYNINLAINHHYIAAKLYNAINKKRNALFIYQQIVQELDYNGAYNDCINLLDSITPFVARDDSLLLGYLHTSYAFAYAGMNDLSKAEIALAKSRCYLMEAFLNEDLSYIANIYAKATKPDSVAYYIALCNNDPYYFGNITHILNQEWLAKNFGDYPRACQLADSALQLTNIHSRNILKEQAFLAQADYYMWEAQREKDNNRYKTVMLFSAIALSVLIISIIWQLYKKRQNRLIVQIGEKMLEITRLRNEVSALYEKLNNENIPDTTPDQFKRLLETGFATLNTISESRFLINRESNSPKTDGQKLKALIQSEIDCIKNETFLNSIIEYVNTIHPNLINDLALEIPSLKQKDILIIALKLAGFSVQSICVILDISLSNYYTRWHRIRNRILNCETSHKDYFANMLL